MSSAENTVNLPEKSKDVSASWVGTSRFLFYLSLVIGIAFFIGMCVNLYTHRYKGHPEVEVPANTQFHPEYK